MGLVNTRKDENGRTEYYCPHEGWVAPKTVNNTGYNRHVCPYCDWELNDDPYNELAREQEKAEAK